jgi:tRNA threonylcarbamoyladenosine biosynthesis protein TsaB
VAQGLALGTNLPVVGVCTLEALAEASGKPRVIAALDARMGEVYHAAYERRGGDWHAVHEPGLCKPDAAPELPAGAWTGCGSGFAAYRAALESRYAGRLEHVNDKLVPHAREIAALAAVEFKRGGAVSAEYAAPLYVRNKVALRMDER